MKADRRVCPNCERGTGKVHDRREQAKGDVALGGRRVVLVLVRRRFRCTSCSKVFTEPDELCGWRRRLTVRFREHLYEEAGHGTVKRVACKAGVSEDTVRRAFVEIGSRRMAEREEEPVQRLGMDEFSVRKGQRYQTAFYDLDHKRVLGIVLGRRREDVLGFLERLADPEAVRVVTMDMSRAYRSAVELCLVNAEIVVDKFHVVKRVNEQLDRVRIRLQAEQGVKEMLYRSRYLLLRNREELDEGQKEKLELVLGVHPDLRKAWLLKEDFRRWYSLQTKGAARLELAAWVSHVQEVGPAEMRVLLPMLTNWREEILNYFDHKLTNGFVEGKNTRTKQIQRQAYGYRNLDNLNLRIMLPAA